MERSGAAQGLAEVLAVLGPDHLAALLPDILQSCRAARHFEREGALTLFKFLPLAVPDEVQVCTLCTRKHAHTTLLCSTAGFFTLCFWPWLKSQEFSTSAGPADACYIRMYTK